jgi:pimeloyl-ACP methyl ester carboxylesterase
MMKRISLNIFLVMLMAVEVLAEGETEPVAITDTATQSIPATDPRMLRQNSDVVGFQPLTVAGQQIPATYLQETSGEALGIIVFLHDRGQRFENYGITPQRHALLDYGWSTLSFELNYTFEPNLFIYDPALEAREAALAKVAKPETSEDPDAEPAWDDPKPKESSQVDIPDVPDKVENKKLPPVSNEERIEAVMAFIQAKEVERIIFIGHGAGGEKAVELLETIKIPVDALILVGTSELETDKVWETFKFPILDLYGTNDAKAVSLAVKHRKKIMKSIGNTQYETRKIVGADHVFYGLQPQLTSTIRRWLNKLFVEIDTE